MKKNLTKSHIYVAGSFGTVILLLIAIIVLWKYNEYIREKHLKQIEQHQAEYRAIGKAIHYAHLRAITLYRMTTLRDPFDIDETYIEFQKHGEGFMKQRDFLVSSNFDSEEKAVWENVRTILNRGYQSQYDVIRLINQGEFVAASSLISTQVSSIQDELQKKLDELLYLKTNRLNQANQESKKIDKTIDIFVYLLSFICVVLSVLTIIVTRRTAKTEAALSAQGFRIRLLYEVASQSHTSFDDQIDDTLKAGCDLFGLEIGKLCKIDPELQSNKMINVVVGKNITTMLKKNLEMPLEKTFCSIPYSENRIVLINQIATSRYKSYPCVEFANLGAYIAAPVYVFGEKFGTINFSSFKGRRNEFTEDDHDLLYLIGKFVSVILETKLSQEMIIEKKAADDANAAKSRFLSNMSHELRTPLNAIIGYSELILSENTIDDQNTIEDIVRINKSGLHLLHLVNNVLDISKVESGKMTVEVEEFVLDELIGNVADIMAPMIQENNNKFVVHSRLGAVILFSDRQKIKQVLLNLLSNAAKFTRNGEIAVIVDNTISDHGASISITVTDTGAGISDVAQRFIFEEFAQDSNHSLTNHSGTGLGLSICKTFCRLLGGDINVNSRLGVGSQFSVSLPVRYSPPMQNSDYQTSAIKSAIQ